jgi:hypothetical protein
MTLAKLVKQEIKNLTWRFAVDKPDNHGGSTSKNAKKSMENSLDIKKVQNLYKDSYFILTLDAFAR